MTKEEHYKSLLPQVKALCEGENDMIAKMANVAALLHTEFGFWWTGFYRVVNNELLLGPFQGPIACVHIAFGRGVCGTAWKERRTVVVPDVEEFPGHIACSSESRSEIVVPVFRSDNITLPRTCCGAAIIKRASAIGSPFFSVLLKRVL